MKTIAAIATPLLNCAIHIIRISGPDCFAIVQKICQKPIKKEPYTIQRNYIIDGNNIIDDVLLNVFVKPKSYTGEDVIEINCHGGVVIAKKILSLLLINGCDMANNGEFSQQAYLNKKMNYLQIEAINNLIHATNETATNYAINSIINSDFEEIEKIRNRLFEIMGSIEVNIDYPEYDDVPHYTNKEIINLLREINDDVKKIINDSKVIMPIFSGLNVAIVGRPNVGKSSLLNLLINQDKAIVSDIEGTTRDVVEARVNIEGITINLYDTAGIHETNDKLEKIGIDKTMDVINKADIIILLVDDVNDDSFDFISNKQNAIKIYNKSDIKKYPLNTLSISVKNNDINALLKALRDKLSIINSYRVNGVILQSDRQIVAMNKISSTIDFCLTELDKNCPIDILQSYFEKCIILFNNILGINFEYDKLDELFNKFCLGK